LKITPFHDYNAQISVFMCLRYDLHTQPQASGPANPSPWIKPSHNLGLADGQIAIGKTKIFIKDPKSVAAIESAFQTHKNYLASEPFHCIRLRFTFVSCVHRRCTDLKSRKS
jgi:hypothetical protein